MNTSKDQLVVIQASSFCNINCSYCYLPNRNIHRMIKISTLKKIAEFVFSNPFASDSITIVWHVGEPLSVPISFYDKAIDVIDSLNFNKVKIVHSFQTNGTLITKKWCDFIGNRSIKVGVSLDGPQFIHDHQRIDKKNEGTFEKVMAGIDLLRNAGISPSIISVITRKTVDFPQEFFDFFYALYPPSLGLNVEVSEGVNSRSSLFSEEDISAFDSFIKKIIQLNYSTPNPINIREISPYLQKILKGSLDFDIIPQPAYPFAILNFDSLGNFSTFSPELLGMSHPIYGSLTFGNVEEQSMEQILKSSQLLNVTGEINAGIQKCKAECEYFSFCGGGFPAVKLGEHKTFDATETKVCRMRIKSTIDALIDDLETRLGIQE